MRIGRPRVSKKPASFRTMRLTVTSSIRSCSRAFATISINGPPPGGGPLIDIVAKARLQERIDEVTVDRMVLNGAGFFDTRGRPIRIDPVGLH